MAEIINPAPEIIAIPKADLLTRCMEMKRAGRRLSQCCAAFIDGKYELSYSFADDATYDYTTLKVVVDPDEEVTSITEIFPHASFMENEMSELYGVRIRMIADDYHGKLYRVGQEAPMLTDADRKQIDAYMKAKQEAAEKAAADTSENAAAGAAGENGTEADQAAARAPKAAGAADGKGGNA